MAMTNKNSRSAIIVVFAALLMGSLSSAGWTFQRRNPSSEEDRRRALERLNKQVQESQQGAKPATSPFGTQQQVPPQQPGTTPATPPPIPAVANAAPRESGRVLLNLENADLYDFINQMSSTLALTPLIVDPDVKGTVNLNSGSISKDDVFPLFQLILKNNNAALIRQDGTYQIIPISSALKRGVEIIESLPSASDGNTRQAEPDTKPAGPRSSKDPAAGTARPVSGAAPISPKSALTQPKASGKGESKGSHLATHVIRVEFVPIKDLIEPIRQLLTEGGVIMPYERLNMLIVTDYTDNVSRIMEIVRILDDNYLDPDLVELVKINNNASSDIVDDLRKLFGSGTKDSATGISFVSLDRLNAIFVMASSKRALEEVKGWVKELDSSSAKNIQTYFYVVENSTASQIAMMLSALYGGESFSSNTNGSTGASGTGGITGNPRSQGSAANTSAGAGSMGGGNTPFASSGQSYRESQYSGYNNSSSGYGGFAGGNSGFGSGRQLGPQLNVSRNVYSQVLRGGEFTGLQDTVRMVVDDVNNTLIIQATAADYAYISDTIKRMDVLPRQVLIDARIFEVDLTENLDFGITAALRAKTDNHLTVGDLNPLTGKGDPSGLLTAKTFIPIGNSREIMAALAAMHLKTKVRVLEAPSVLALDGQQAEIVVGAEIPYPSTSFTPAAGGSSTSVLYRDTGISLMVLPRISASGSVTMDLMQEVSSPGADIPVGDGAATSFNKTSVKTTLSVKDGETVGIAGLIRDSNDLSRSGVPFLSQIPLIGSLFGQTSKNSSRRELIILITPHVIRTPEKLNEMTQELRDSLKNVRKYAEEKEKNIAKDVEDARNERYEEKQKSLSKIKAPKPATQKQEKAPDNTPPVPEPQPAIKPE